MPNQIKLLLFNVFFFGIDGTQIWKWVPTCFFQRCSYFVCLTLKVYLPPCTILFLFKLTSSLFRAQADNLPARGQGEHQLHQQLQLPCCQVVLAPQQQDGGQVDGHLLPSNFWWHWSWELLLSAQLSCAARTFPGTRAGAVGHMQGRYANHTWDGDTNGKNSASWYSSWQADISSRWLGDS